MGYDEWLNGECRICDRLLEKYLSILNRFSGICGKVSSNRVIALILLLLTIIGAVSFAQFVIGPGVASEQLSEEERADKFTNWALVLVGLFLAPFWAIAVAVFFLRAVGKE